MSHQLPLTPAPLVQRGRSRLSPNRWLTWDLIPDARPQPLGPEWIWRGLADVDLADDAQVLAVLDRVGMIWGHYEDLRDDNTTPAEQGYPQRPTEDVDFPTIHMMDAIMYLETLRRIADQWARHAEIGGALPEDFWYALGLGLRPFTMLTTVRASVHPKLTRQVVDLYEAGCWQLAQTILANPEVRRCQNATCGRVFFQRTPATTYRVWATQRAKYCSDACMHIQNQRQYRARRRAAAIDT
jgi:hypothetical protein